jgi:uncharacterized integral membrane protein (TIGR00697 family)
MHIKETRDEKTVTLPFMLLGILFCICLITSNLLSTKVIQIGNLLTVTGGIFVFPISYIINDCIAEVWGYKKIRLVIWVGFASNLLVLVFAQIAIICPSPQSWNGEESFNFVFNLAPRITIASFMAFLAGSFLNAFIMSKMKIMSKGKYFSFRAIASTLAGETADSFIFFPIAFLGLVSGKDLLTMILTQICLKSLYEIIVLPATVQFVKYLKKIENMDMFDNDISYNILKIDNI